MADTLAAAMIEAQAESIGSYSMINDELVINDETKTIYIPESERIFGVESDQKTERKYFKCSRYVGDNIDLLEMSISINFSNANGEKDVYIVDDVKEDAETEGNIVFSWLLSRKVTKYKGFIQFIVCATKTDEAGTVAKEWNTTIAEGEVLVGLEAEVQPEESEADVLRQLVEMSLEASRKAENATSGANAALQEVSALKSKLEGLIKEVQDALEKLEGAGGKDFRDVPVEFTESETLENIASGETVPTVFGKVQKVFNNFGEAAGMDVANSLNDITEQSEKVANAKMLLDVSGSKVKYGNGTSRDVKEGTLKTLFEEQENNMQRILQTVSDLDIDKVDVMEYNERKNVVDRSLNTINENITNLRNDIDSGVIGGEGTKDYNDLINKPMINGNVLSGNMTTSDIGVTIPSVPSALPNPYPVTFDGMLKQQVYDGSSAVNVTFPDMEVLNETAGTPVGEIISFMGNTAPTNYLICDGATYNIVDYPYLTQHFKDQFGSVNFFGGDGTTTFAVPDLRAEFLRGSGTANRDTGSGSNVGYHQHPTKFPHLYGYGGGFSNNTIGMVRENTGDTTERINEDRKYVYDVIRNTYIATTTITDSSTHDAYYTSRPTNTSVLYCIKYKPTYLVDTGRKWIKNTDTLKVYEEDGIVRVLFNEHQVTGSEMEIPEINEYKCLQMWSTNDVIIRLINSTEVYDGEVAYHSVDKKVFVNYKTFDAGNAVVLRGGVGTYIIDGLLSIAIDNSV